MTTTQAQLLQFCRDYECETLSEVLLAVAESSRHCTSEGGGRIPTWPLKEAASRLSEMDAENKRLREALTTIGHSLVCAPIDYAEHNAGELLRAGNIARAALEHDKGEPQP